MEITDTQYIALLRYLDNELSEEDEMLFVEELSDSPALQQALDFELLLRQQNSESEASDTQPAHEYSMLESADTHLERIETILSPVSKSKDAPAMVHFSRRYRKQWIAAAAIIIIIAGSTWPVSRRSGDNHSIKEDIVLNDSSKKHVPQNSTDLRNEDHLLAQTLTPVEIADRYYERYKPSEEDPVEISETLGWYRERRYDRILKASTADYQTKGNMDADEEKAIVNYTNFYKALSLAERKRYAEAMPAFSKIVAATKPRAQIHYHAQWYLLLSSLEMQDKESARKLAITISRNKSHLYYKKAGDILKLLQ